MIIDIQKRFDSVNGAARTSLFIDAEHLSVLGNQKLAEIVGDGLAIAGMFIGSDLEEDCAQRRAGRSG